jgi:hypothetical protein
MLLEVLTRTHKRPAALARNQKSVANLPSSLHWHTIVEDTVGMGIAATYDWFATYDPLGDWVWILDDDDECTDALLTMRVQKVESLEPEVDCIMVRMDHGPELGILPGEGTWAWGVSHGAQGVSSFIVRRATWQQCKGAFTPGHYASDWSFIKAVFDSGANIKWLDVVASRTQAGRHMGVTE